MMPKSSQKDSTKKLKYLNIPSTSSGNITPAHSAKRLFRQVCELKKATAVSISRSRQHFQFLQP